MRWMYGIYNIIYRLVHQSTEYIFILQVFEWGSMIYIIVTQKGRNPEVILFDYNNENLDETDVVLKREQCQDTADYIKHN